MNNKQKTIRLFMVITSLLGLNLLILGKAFAQSQTASLTVQPGNLTLAVPTSVSFPRAILVPGNPTVLTAVENPNDQLQTIEVVDPWSGSQFHVNLSMENLADSSGHVVPYTDFGVITLHANTASESVDTSNTNPPGTNNIDSPLSYYYEQTTSNPTTFPTTSFTSMPLDSADPDPTDAGSVSLPITLMQRTVNNTSTGFYSVGLALRVNIPADFAAGNYNGQLTFSLDP